jgi:hypothetical protein
VAIAGASRVAVAWAVTTFVSAPPHDVTVDVPGDGWTLDALSAAPNAFPLTSDARPLRYGCDNGTPDPGDDTCGDAGSGFLSAFVVSGRSTTRDVSMLQPWEMPTEVPGSTSPWMEFECRTFDKSFTMPASAVQVIKDLFPTRVELQVRQVVGELLADGNNYGIVLVGHGFVGHTTAPPP